MKAYGVTTHRHTPEIEEQLSLVAGEKVCVNFTPHLVPMNRGILVTAYASLKQGVTEEMVREAYDSCYNSEKFCSCTANRDMSADEMGGRKQLCGCWISD